jgi:hypothetical protein
MKYLGAHTFGFIWDSTGLAATERLIEAGFPHVEYLATVPHLDAWRTDRATPAALRRAVR